MTLTETINAWMILFTKRDAQNIAARLPRPPKPPVDVSGTGCVHVEDPYSSLSSKREMCGRPVQKDAPHAWLCFLHHQQVHPSPAKAVAEVRELVRAEADVVEVVYK